MLTRDHLRGELLSLAEEATAAAATVKKHTDEPAAALLAEGFMSAAKLREQLAKLSALLSGTKRKRRKG
jgi:hypothetical protein